MSTVIQASSDRAQLATFDQNFVKSCQNLHQKLKRKVAGFLNKSYGQGNVHHVRCLSSTMVVYDWDS